MWPAIIAAAAQVGSSLIGGRATKKAAQQQAESASAADATQRYFYDTTREDNMPALEGRNWAIEQLRERLGGAYGQRIDPGDVTQEPGYQFGRQESMNALNATLAARGMRNSGAALKAATRFGNDYATTKYDNAFNREVANRSAVLNPLQSFAGLSQTGASTIAGAGQNTANALSANAIGLGNAQAAARIGGANALGDTINRAAGWYMSQDRGGASPWSFGANDGLQNANAMNAFNYNQYSGGSNDGY